MKKFISFIFLCLMSIQVLPIKEVGKLLFNNQIVEEHVDSSGENSGSKCGFKLLKDFYGRNSDLSEHIEHAIFVSVAHYQSFENIPTSPVKEIHTPPPNTYFI